MRPGIPARPGTAHDRHHGTPVDDQLLAQKFYLEHHEAEFLAVANRH